MHQYSFRGQSRRTKTNSKTELNVIDVLEKTSYFSIAGCHENKTATRMCQHMKNDVLTVFPKFLSPTRPPADRMDCRELDVEASGSMTIIEALFVFATIGGVVKDVK